MGMTEAPDDDTERTECWRCGYNRPTYESCPRCGGSCKPRTKRKQKQGTEYKQNHLHSFGDSE